MFQSCFCAILCCVTVSLAAAQTSEAVPGLSLVPLWPQDGDSAPLEKDHYVFYDLRAGEYVVSYPTDFGAPETSDRITLRFGTHSLVDPQITSRVSAGTGGAFHYTYLVANGTQARQSIRRLILAVPADDQSAQFQTGIWKTTRAAGEVPGLASPVAHLVVKRSTASNPARIQG
jgi:hypothetical protein